MAGYKDMEELFRLTKKSFINLIREDEKKKIEASIWKQIDNGMKMIIFTFIYEERMERICLCLTMGELLRVSNMAKYFMYCSWTGRI